MSEIPTTLTPTATTYPISTGSISIVTPTVTKPVPSELFVLVNGDATWVGTREKALSALAGMVNDAAHYEGDSITRWLFVNGEWELQDIDDEPTS